MEEIQQNEINENNAKLLFKPKFIPLYTELLELWLSINEALVYWFIDFYLQNENDKFYFTNEQIWSIFWFWWKNTSLLIGKLKDKWLIETSYKIKANWWKIRFIKKVNSDCKNFYSQNRKIFTNNNNNINNNNININSKELIEKSEDFSLSNDKKENFWNLEINNILETLKKLNNWLIDWTVKEQRNYWKLLRDKIQKINWFDGDFEKFLNKLYELSDEYRVWYFSSPKKLYYNLAWVVQSITARVKEKPKPVRRNYKSLSVEDYISNNF